MNKFLSIILISAIFGSSLCGKNRAQRKGNNAQLQAAHLLRYEDPKHYSECGAFYETAKAALTSAVSTLQLGLSAEDLENATADHCKWGMSSYDWYIFEYPRGNEICKVYVVATVTNFMLAKQKNKFNLNKEQTKRANEEKGGCRPKPQDMNAKVVVDISEEIQDDIEFDLSESSKSEKKQQQKQEPKQESKQESKQEQKQAQVPQTKNESQQTSDREAPKVKDENTQTSIQDNTNQSAQEETIFTIRPNTFGPAGFKLPMKPQKQAKERTNRKQPKIAHDINEDDTYKAMRNMFEQHEDEPIAGGWEPCTQEDKKLVPQVFGMLIAQGKIHGVAVYSQNVIECQHQVVAGMNYNVVVAFNHKKCQLAFYRDLQGEVSLFSGAPAYEGVQDCTEVLKA